MKRNRCFNSSSAVATRRFSGLKFLVVYVMLCVGRLTKIFAAETAYEPNWASLEHYQCPEWFRDAKFGIFMHWGPCSVPTGGNDGWYGRQMYMQEGAPWGKAYEFQVKTYGHPSKVGYKDIIPLWKAERWDPDELVGFYKKIGAHYIVPVAVHHDNFDCYASTYQPWNSVNLGPKRDIIGDWRKAILKAGLHFGVSSHSDRAWGWFETSHQSDTKGPLKGVPYDGNLRAADGRGKWWDGYDPQDLYCPPIKPGGWDKQDPAVMETFNQKWYRRTLELVDKYQPDLLYFDGGMPMGDLGLKVVAHLYNLKLHGDQTEAVVNIKWNPLLQAVVDDQEKGLANGIRPQPWQVDASINNMWFADDLPLEMTGKQIIDALVDTVSKNGNLLLNVALAADGTLPDEQRHRLQVLGDWLSINGEAIYGTRPTHLSGEGPTYIEHWQSVDSHLPALTARDIRFTCKGDTLYAICLGWPDDGHLNIASLRKEGMIFPGTVTAVEILGDTDKLNWKQDQNGLEVTLPAKTINSNGVALKISGLSGLNRDGVVRPLADNSVQLKAWDARCIGSHLRLLSSSASVGDWSDGHDYVTWDFICPVAGTYEIVARYATGEDGAEAKVITPNGTLRWSIAKTGSSDKFQVKSLGSQHFDKPGRYTLTFKPVQANWKSSFRLTQIQLKDPTILPRNDGSLSLEVADATLDGSKFFLQTNAGHRNVGGWTDASESVSWNQVKIAKPGAYEIFLEAVTGGEESITVSLGGKKVTGHLPLSEKTDDFKLIPVGRIQIDAPGVYGLEVNPEPTHWHWINLARVVLKRALP